LARQLLLETNDSWLHRPDWQLKTYKTYKTAEIATAAVDRTTFTTAAKRCDAGRLRSLKRCSAA
jgi:hypothetical protein